MRHNNSGIKILPFPLTVGSEIAGDKAVYAILKQLGKGGRGSTYLAEQKSSKGRRNPKVVIKSPNIDLGRSPEDIIDRLVQIRADMEREINAFQRLSSSPAVENRVADVIDNGSFNASFKGIVCRVDFIVQEFIDGMDLLQWCETYQRSAESLGRVDKIWRSFVE
jgi:serine/threonine protein kinase